MIISDVNVHDIGGIEMLKTIKAMPEYEQLPVIVLTTGVSKALISRAKVAGAKGWLVKPFKPGQLQAAVTGLTNLMFQ